MRAKKAKNDRAKQDVNCGQHCFLTLPEVQVKLKEDQQMREDAKAANGMNGASESAYSSACGEDSNDSLQKRKDE